MSTRLAPTAALLWHNNDYSIAVSIFVAATISAAVFPRIVVGAALTFLVQKICHL